MRERRHDRRDRAAKIATRLADAYPGLDCPLIHRNNFELLVAVILSAQCTDAAVNTVTPALFERYPTPYTMAQAEPGQIEQLIRRLGLFRAKAKSLQRCALQLVEDFGGVVPCTLESLTQLAGVGRKTANVMLGHAFGQPGVAVDTHCRRLANRLQLSRYEDPTKIELDLKQLLPVTEWTGFSHRLILHGRRICHARKPRCERCTLQDLCPSAAVSH